MTTTEKILQQITHALSQREALDFQSDAYRIFNGFYEGVPGLVLDRYRSALVIFDHGEPGERQEEILKLSQWGLANIEGLESGLVKQRQHPQASRRNGILNAGTTLPESITEFGVQYALDLQMNQDASFYLDTRNLRRWLIENMAGLRVLNTFAYTGSLGVAAGVGGAKKVVQTDLKGAFLEIARQSWRLNNLHEDKCQILEGDFFRVAGLLRNKKQLFDCVILDPPFFSTTTAGKIDLKNETTRLVNKIRPVVAHEGTLVLINNALFLSGASFMDELNTLCESPYLTLDQIIPVPADITGFPKTIVDTPPADPAPFNHPTKIAILKVFRKDERQ